MTFETIIYEKANGIAKITLNRPKVLNAFNQTVVLELKSAFQSAAEDKDVGIVVLTGAGRAFSAGVDLTAMGDTIKEQGGVGPVMDIPGRELIDTIQSMPKVVIAMVNGFCLTGALELALTCDLIIASEDAKFGDTHVRWGAVPSWGMSQRLPRLLGVLKAKELSFTAEMITAKEAERIGLINRAVPADKLEKTVRELAKKIMANSRDAVGAVKYLYNQGMKLTLEKGLELEYNSKFVIRDTPEMLDKFKKKD